MDTLDRSPIDPYLEYTLMQRMAVAQVPDSDPVDFGPQFSPVCWHELQIGFFGF
jgi:hypothetical protein